MKDSRLAEMAREGDMLVVADTLIGEDEDEMVCPGVAPRLARFHVERPAQVDAAELGAQGRMSRRDDDSHVGSLATAMARRCKLPPLLDKRAETWISQARLLW
jgi:hypothetical protein